MENNEQLVDTALTYRWFCPECGQPQYRIESDSNTSVTAFHDFKRHQPVLNGEDYPVLERIWDNPSDDAAFN